jgi:hypothetical protein
MLLESSTSPTHAQVPPLLRTPQVAFERSRNHRTTCGAAAPDDGRKDGGGRCGGAASDVDAETSGRRGVKGPHDARAKRRSGAQVGWVGIKPESAEM